MVGAAVQHQRVGGQLRRDLTAGAVRQGEHDDVVAREGVDARGDDLALGKRAQVWLMHPQSIAGGGVRGQGAEFDIRVLAEDAQDLAADVSGGSRDCDLECHVHNYT